DQWVGDAIQKAQPVTGETASHPTHDPFHFLFFFSSRRRHTRCLSDWSSDVCSSDLLDVMQAMNIAHGAGVQVIGFTPPEQAKKRSEERRVGKECRARRSQYP